MEEAAEVGGAGAVAVVDQAAGGGERFVVGQALVAERVPAEGVGDALVVGDAFGGGERGRAQRVVDAGRVVHRPPAVRRVFIPLDERAEGIAICTRRLHEPVPGAGGWGAWIVPRKLIEWLIC